MLWIRFDEEDRRTSAPQFCLYSIQGERVCLQDLYEENNLVLVFIHGLNCPDCRSTVQAFVERETEYRGQAGKVLFILPDDNHNLHEQVGKDHLLSSLTGEVLHSILVDPEGTTRRRYADLMSASLVGDEDTVIFVLDTYGAPYTAVIAQELNSEEVHKEILSWLQYINIQCPE